MESQFEAAVEAVISGDVETLTALLREDPSLVVQRSGAKHKATLLHYVAANGVEPERQKTPRNAVEVAEILLNAGAEVDSLAETYGGGSAQTPLMLLVSSAHPAQAGVQADLVETFCKAGAAVNGLDDNGAPLATALAFWYPAAAEALARCGARLSNIVFAAALGRLDLVKSFLKEDQPLKPDVIDKAFVCAGMCGRIEVADFLLQKGVNINAAPLKNQTALHNAAYTGQAEMVRFLLEKGTDPNLRDTQFQSTPAGWAWEGGHKEIANYLLDHSEPDVLDAVEFGRLDLAKALLGEGHPSDAYGRGERGVLLRIAAFNGRLDIAEFLLERGADPNLADSQGNSPLQCAMAGPHEALVDLLKRRGATD